MNIVKRKLTIFYFGSAVALTLASCGGGSDSDGVKLSDNATYFGLPNVIKSSTTIEPTSLSGVGTVTNADATTSSFTLTCSSSPDNSEAALQCLPDKDVNFDAASAMTVDWKVDGILVAASSYSVTNGGNPESTEVNLVDAFDDDGIPFLSDNCPRLANAEQLNSDDDLLGDACDDDDDNDGVEDAVDNCPLVQNVEQENIDEDMFGNACDEDSDSDGIDSSADNCPLIMNVMQEDTDGDGQGDVCDNDFDNDLITDNVEGKETELDADSTDTDGDETPDYKDSDSDGDGIPDIEEAYKIGDSEKITLADTDEDGVPDFRDLDSDGDKLPDSLEKDFVDSVLDCDVLPSFRDLDSDDDGLSDYDESVLPSMPSGQEITKLEDKDKDGIPDLIDGTSIESRGGVPDAADYDNINFTQQLMDLTDLDEDSIADSFQTEDKSMDVNGNTVKDEFERRDGGNLVIQCPVDSTR